MSEGETRSRKAMAHRALALRDGLRSSERRNRAMAQSQRRHKLEMQVLDKLHGENVQKERIVLDQHYGSQMKALVEVGLTCLG